MNLFIGLFAALLFGIDTPPIQTAPTPKTPLTILVPAYFYPVEQGLEDWNRLIKASHQVSITAIVNPASGPGKEVDPNYIKVFELAAKEPVTLIGYVTTSYCKRPIEDVKADVDRWLKFYPNIVGIFFDEQASGAEFVEYQATLYKYVRVDKKRQLVITNPGTVCAEGFLSKPATDSVCLFEGPQPLDPKGLPVWSKNYKPMQIVALSYKVKTLDSMRECIHNAVGNNVGYFYVTDAEGANPWNRLPAYWDEEVAAFRTAKPNASR
jgi:hypothetical protein